MYSKHHQEIVKEINILMESFTHTKKDIGYGRRWTFENKMWFDVIDYKRTGEIFLRVGRGARLVKTYPMLHTYFDEIKKVVAKIIIPDAAFLHERHIVKMFALLDQAPEHVPAIP